ncbi:hypothetical protein PQR52_01590 [Paraburkholderia aspalathi]|uniref:hypothetical protein n=1 Tax=Paraburkholderia aspalathi TaxID=1324617 RepID=UPI0038BB027F
MLSQAEKALRGIFGNAYPTNHDLLADQESQRRAAASFERELLLHRSRLPANHPESLNYRPAVVVTPEAADELVATLSQESAGVTPVANDAVARQVATAVTTATVESDDVTADVDDDVSSLVSTEMSSSWMETIRAWTVTRQAVTETVTAQTMFSTEELLESAFHMTPSGLTRADRQDAARVLNELGFKSKAVRVAGKVVRRWMRNT